MTDLDMMKMMAEALREAGVPYSGWRESREAALAAYDSHLNNSSDPEPRKLGADGHDEACPISRLLRQESGIVTGRGGEFESENWTCTCAARKE